MGDRTVVLIPAYEPTSEIIELLKELTMHKVDIVVVNDGSGPSYDNIFKAASQYAQIIDHEHNMGKGAALKTGLKYVSETIKENFFVVTMDADGQHSVLDATKLIEYIKNNPSELVLGKRIRSKKTPIKSRFGNAITRFAYKITTGLDVYDTQTGLRAFSNNLVPLMLEINGEKFDYEMNVLLKCAKKKIKIHEIEIETIYIDNNSHSHFDPIKDSMLIYKEIFKFLMSSLISFFVDYGMYSLLVLTTNKLTFSNILARIISATVNFNINKKVVFKNYNKDYKQILEYFILATVVLVLNTAILNMLVNVLGVNKYIAKLIVEMVLIFFSWIVQKKIIFSKKG